MGTLFLDIFACLLTLALVLGVVVSILRQHLRNLKAERDYCTQMQRILNTHSRLTFDR